MKKENVRKLLEVKKELRYNDKVTELIDDVIVDECGKDTIDDGLLKAILGVDREDSNE